MTYRDAMGINEGDTLRTVYGETGTVIAKLDRGISVHFTLIRKAGPRRWSLIEAHSSNVFPAQ